jgi:hypothetical protein
VTDFRLDKWYFDCVSADGAVLIGYAARLKWGRIGLDYGARITKAQDGPLSQRQSLSFGRVEIERDGVRWGNDALGVAGSWTGGRGFDSLVLFDGADGRVEWQCLGANAEVSVRMDGRVVEGLGYADRITMTAPPWRLPFRELRWGRYISEDGSDHVVWIDLRGTLRHNWVWMNGTTPVEGTVTDTGVRADDGELLFEASRPIRRGNVVETLLGRSSFLARLLPRNVRAIEEDKQLSSCVLKSEGAESRGFSIHEVVGWL